MILLANADIISLTIFSKSLKSQLWTHNKPMTTVMRHFTTNIILKIKLTKWLYWIIFQTVKYNFKIWVLEKKNILMQFCCNARLLIYLLYDQRAMALYKIYNITYITTTKKHIKTVMIIQNIKIIFL